MGLPNRAQTRRGGPGQGRFYPGLWMGIVTDNNDPTKNGRVKVRVPDLGGQLNLAWARVTSPLGGNGTGGPIVPPVDARVWVIFEAEDSNRPVVLTGLWELDGEQSQIPAAARGDEDPIKNSRDESETVSGARNVQIVPPGNTSASKYPQNYVFKTPGGHLIEADDTPGAERIAMTHSPSGSWFEFHLGGKLQIGVKDQRYTFVEQGDDLHIKGDQNSVVEGDTYYKTGEYNQTCQKFRLLSLGEFKVDAVGPANLTAQSREVTTTTGQFPLGNVVTTTSHPIDFITGIPIQGHEGFKAGIATDVEA